MKEQLILQFYLDIMSAIKTHRTVGLITHHNPDGDGLAACLAIQEIFRVLDRTAMLVVEEPTPPNMEFLNLSGRSILFSDDLQFELLILIDCHEARRIGECEALLPRAKSIFAIDHHHPGVLIPNARSWIEPQKASAGAMIFDLFRSIIPGLPDENRIYILQAIYTTIVNDTDYFSNPNTTRDVFVLCGELCTLGLEPIKVVEEFTFGRSVSEVRFVGSVMETMDTCEDGRILFVHSSIDMLEQHGLGHEATSKMTRWFQSIRDIIYLVFLREVETDVYRVSLRSRTADVNRIAAYFNGGGHRLASGCELRGSLAEVKRLLLEQLRLTPEIASQIEP